MNLVDPCKVLRRSEIACCSTFGFWMGILPIPVFSTVILLSVLWLLSKTSRYGVPVPQALVATAVSYAIKPLRIVLIPIWIIVGAKMFGLPSDQCDISAMYSKMTTDITKFIGEFTVCIVMAISAWSLCSLVVLPALMIWHRSNKRVTDEYRVVVGTGAEQAVQLSER